MEAYRGAAEELLRVVQQREPTAQARIRWRWFRGRRWSPGWCVRVVRDGGEWWDYEDVYSYWIAEALVGTFGGVRRGEG